MIDNTLYSTVQQRKTHPPMRRSAQVVNLARSITRTLMTPCLRADLFSGAAFPCCAFSVVVVRCVHGSAAGMRPSQV